MGDLGPSIRMPGEATVINTVHVVKSRKCEGDQDGGVDQVLQRDAGRVAMVPGRWDHEDSRRSDCKDLDTRQDPRSLLGCKASGGFSGFASKPGARFSGFSSKPGAWLVASRATWHHRGEGFESKEWREGVAAVGSTRSELDGYALGG